MTNDPFMILILILSQQDNLQPMITSSFLTNIHLLVSFSVPSCLRLLACARNQSKLIFETWLLVKISCRNSKLPEGDFVCLFHVSEYSLVKP